MLLKLLTLAYALGLASLIWMAGTNQLPEWAMRVYYQPYGDDLAHAGLAAGLTVLVSLAFGDRRVRLAGRSLPLGPVLVLLVLGLEELSQAFIDTRVLSPYDLLSTTLGVLIGAALARLLTNHRRAAGASGGPPPGLASGLDAQDGV